MVARSAYAVPAHSPTKATDSEHWMDQAACKDWDFKTNGDPFFPVSSGLAAAKEALTICADCPVQRACQFYAYERTNTQTNGVFGGTLPEDRIRNARRAQRAKSRKSRAKEDES